MKNLENRKRDHIDLALRSGTPSSARDPRFRYEPMLRAHPTEGLEPVTFLGKEMRAPIWVSSMTGGTRLAGTINRNLARACNEFGMGMGLGSCRILLEDETHFSDFDMRDLIGNGLPLWANLGIAQVEELLERKQMERVIRLVERVRADGLIIHVNPMQEWFQPEGDLLHISPLETIKKFLEQFPMPVIVKEVGQGMGPLSLQELMKLPVQAIEFAAFGGTNFVRMELMREHGTDQALFEPLAYIGEDAMSMLESVNRIAEDGDPACRELIISGGVRTFLDGYYLIRKSKLPAVYGMASRFLEYARGDYQQLKAFVQAQVKGLEMAYAYLHVNG